MTSQPQLPPPGFIDFTLQGNSMTSSMIRPTVLIDGYACPVQYGYNRIPVVPGRHHVSVYAQWMRNYGQAELVVDVAQGQHVPVFYRAPLHQFTDGNIGHVPQRAKGLGVLLTIIAAPLLLIALVVLVDVLAG